MLCVKAGGGFEESKVVNVGPVSGAANTCALTGTSATVVGCTTIVPRQADLAISDVNPLELYAVYAGVKLGTPAKPTTVATPLAMQGFGVAVNPNLYNKLQAQQIASGEIPASASCATGDYTLACQPSIKSAQYSALVSKDGSIKTAAALVGDTADTSVLTLARRDDLSGTQAASNIFFARNACGGIGYDATSKSFNRLDGATKDSKVNFAALGGGLDIISSTDSTANLVVQANATSSGVKTALQSTSGYAIGVLGLGSNSGYKFVKIDGQSPNFKLDGTADSKFRSNMINGRYPFQVASFAAQLPKPAGVLKTLPGLATAVINGLKDSTLHDLTAIGYLDGGSNAAKASLVTRINGNNCSPLVWK